MFILQFPFRDKLNEGVLNFCDDGRQGLHDDPTFGAFIT